jgi:hypothetical protein
MPKELTMLNLANLCPSSGPVLETLYKVTKDMDQDPSADNRAKLGDGRENTRKLLAEFLHVTPEEIVITRNTSESNNLVSTGLDLKPGDEVLLTADNHPSNHTAWQEKAKRFGFKVIDVPVPNPHPGFDHYVEAFRKMITPQTKVISFTHLTSTVGDLFPAKEICKLARERGILTLVDGAQSFGLLDVDLGDIQPDFYSGSAHKWPCGPKENGVLYINKSAQPKIWASIFSAYPGRVGVTHFRGIRAARRTGDDCVRRSAEAADDDRAGADREALARVDDGADRGPAEDQRGQDLDEPGRPRRAAVLSFQPGNLDVRKLSGAVSKGPDRVRDAWRSGPSRPAVLAALLQHARRRREDSGGGEEVHGRGGLALGHWKLVSTCSSFVTSTMSLKVPFTLCASARDRPGT